MEVQRKVMVLQQRVKELENENGVLRQRLSDALSGKIDVEQYMRQNGISDMLQVTEVSNGNSSTSVALTNGNISPQSNAVPPVPPRSINNNGDFLSGTSPNETKAIPSVGTRLEGLLLNEMENDFDPRANMAGSPTSPPLLAPPPKPARDASRRAQNPDDIFGLSPFKATPRPAGQSKILSSDPFGMGDFGQTGKNGIENDIGLLDKRIKEMKDGFSRGLAMSTEDFSLDSLDPLKK